MATIPFKPKEYYDSPRTETFYMNLSSILCASPGDGQNEEIGFEDWLNGGTINLF